MNEDESEKWLDEYKRHVEDAGLIWRGPHVSSVPFNDDVSCEWWHGKRVLTAFLSNEAGSELVKSWGHNINTEMEIISVDDWDALVAAWKWMQAG